MHRCWRGGRPGTIRTVASRETATPAAPESPPGLDRIRRFLRTPVIRGTWLWIRAIGRWLRDAWRWLRKNAGPLLRGLARAAETGAEAARRAAEAGRIARETGRSVGAWAKRRRAAGSRGRLDDALSGAEKELRDWGGRVEREATDASGVLDSVSEHAGALSGGEAARSEPAPARPPADALPAPPEPERAAPPERLPESPAAPAPRSGGAAAKSDLLGEALARVRKLGRRRRTGPLRDLILEIVAIQESATADELAGWLRMGKKYLRKRHLGPMLDAGQLRLLHPDEPTHPEQAYGVVRPHPRAAAGLGE